MVVLFVLVSNFLCCWYLIFCAVGALCMFSKCIWPHLANTSLCIDIHLESFKVTVILTDLLPFQK